MNSTPPDSPRDDAEEAPSEEFENALKSHEATAPPAEAPATPALRVGSKLRGKVVGITPDHLLIDHGGRSEATAEIGPFRNEDGTIRVAEGEELDLFVVEAGDNLVLAPSVKTKSGSGKGSGGSSKNLDRMREAKAAGMPVSGKVTAVNKGGLEVDLGGARGFCPVSQVELGFCSDPSVYVGRTLEFLVTSVEDDRKTAVVSRRELLRREEREQAKKRLTTLQVGDEVEGKVRRLEPFGAFVDIGGVDAMVHVSEIGLARVGHPREVLKEGETIRARVLRLETGKDGKPRIALSIKSLGPDPWTGVEGRFAPGVRVQGTVVRLTDFGAFIALEPGLDGLVHVSEIAPQRIEKARDVLTQGQTVDAIVLSVDPVKKRIALSIKRAAEGFVEEGPRAPRGGGEMPSYEGPPREGGRREGARREGGRREGGGGGGAGRGAGGRFEGGRPGGRREGGRREGGRGEGPRREGGRGEGMRGGERESRRDVPMSYPPPGQKTSDEPTTMAIALRKALEKSQKRSTEE
jgi:small subunit ribosomal protein S1